MQSVDFRHLSPNAQINNAPAPTHQQYLLAWHHFHQHPDILTAVTPLLQDNFCQYRQEWQQIKQHDDEKALTDWLIRLFNQLFGDTKLAQMPTILVRGHDEPEYFPATSNQPARIEFAHGFFASCLHEISHWCVAGKRRRTLNDFGYWYEADGRNQDTQQLFEQVEIKPQAIECLLTLATGRYFYVSQDNLNANFDTSQSTFAQDVFEQACDYLHNPHSLPSDAKRLLWFFLNLCQHPDYQHTNF
ncbi:MAG: elongation factor P hydroxylase [Moraxella sp.]|nr:elongation factor P hydroxylase [Moraxella sp.]MDO4893954.1 elongation factor P hydroxylase [Moraxella sp.]